MRGEFPKREFEDIEEVAAHLDDIQTEEMVYAHETLGISYGVGSEGKIVACFFDCPVEDSDKGGYIRWGNKTYKVENEKLFDKLFEKDTKWDETVDFPTFARSLGFKG